jgi:hypothetical protein
LNGLDPDGCLVADLRKVQTITFEKLGRRFPKGSSSKLDTDPAKKDIIFCDGEVFSLDRGLLMGAMITQKGQREIFNGYT